MGRNTSIKTETTDNFTQLVDNINNQSLDVGATGKLTTTVDSDIVGAINELDSNMGAKTSLTTTNKTSVVNAINEIDSDIGALSNFDADIRDSNFVSTINTLNAKVNAGTSFNAIGLDSVGNDSDTLLGGFNDSSERASLVAALNTLSQDIGKLDSNVNRDDRLTTTASTLFGAINELDAEIGAASLNTSATTLRGAINEHEADIAALDVFQNIATDSGSISIGADSSNDTLTILGAGSLKTTGFANTVQIDHDVAAASSVNNSGNTFIQDLTIDANGHVTGIASATAVVNDTTLTLTAGNGLTGGGDFTANQSSDETITFNVDSDQRGLIFQMGSSDSDFLKFHVADSAADSDRMSIFFGGTEQFRFTNGGDLHVNNDIIAFSGTTVSDERLKDNITIIDNPIEKINQLSGRYYNWSTTHPRVSGHRGDSDMGVIAQEVEKVFPFLVRNSMQDILTNSDGTTDTVYYKTVNYQPLIGLLIEGMKQLDKEIRELRKGKVE